VTRPGKSPRGKAGPVLAASDPYAGVVRILKDAKEPLAPRDIKQSLRAAGMGQPEVEKAWRRARARFASEDHVFIESGRYTWSAQPRQLSAADALERLTKGGQLAAGRQELAATVRAALGQPSSDPTAAPRQRQAEIDAMRALAELASEVEELTVNEVGSEVLIRRVRAWVKRSGLEPIERAGDPATFDRRRHRPIGPSIRDGAPVNVVRPGYVWKAPTEEVLIGKAVVEE
jgi:hypothetical protein